MALEDKKFLEALNNKFKGEDQESDHTSFYCFGGWRQSERKREFNDTAEKLAKERNMPFYNPDIGVPLGQLWEWTQHIQYCRKDWVLK